MRYFAPAILAVAPLVAASTSSKRGLCYVSTKHESDDSIWDTSSDLTWYYNYEASPTTEYNGKLEFVPMLWGAPTNPSTNTTFYDTVKSLIEDDGMNITYVLGFNEPDGCSSGGSCVSAATAAQVWKTQFEPLKRDFGIKLGAPAVTGATTGFTWLANWYAECATLAAATTDSNTTSCEVDFIPAHWYGNFEGLTSHLGQINGTYPNISSTWLTEFALNDQALSDSQDFATTSFEYLDRGDIFGRYSYFGAFRSDVSNVGPNAAMLTEKGELTDIGASYLGQAATGNVPDGSTSSSSSSSGSSASSVAKFAGWSVAVATSLFWSFL